MIPGIAVGRGDLSACRVWGGGEGGLLGLAIQKGTQGRFVVASRKEEGSDQEKVQECDKVLRRQRERGPCGDLFFFPRDSTKVDSIISYAG